MTVLTGQLAVAEVPISFIAPTPITIAAVPATAPKYQLPKAAIPIAARIIRSVVPRFFWKNSFSLL